MQHFRWQAHFVLEVLTLAPDWTQQYSHLTENVTFLVQAGMFLCFEAGRSSAMCSSASDLTELFVFACVGEMIGKTGMVDSFNVSLSSSFYKKKRGLFFLMKLELSETLKLSTIPVLPIMSLFKSILHQICIGES